MLAVLINVATVLIGSTIGLIFGSRIKETERDPDQQYSDRHGLSCHRNGDRRLAEAG